MSTTPHLCSLIPVFLETLLMRADNGALTLLSKATGTLYRHDGATYLITNWHVFSGRRADSKAPLDKITCGLPTHIRVHFPTVGEAPEPKVQTYDLLNEESEYLWLEHRLANAVDVGALKIDPPADIETVYVSDSIQVPGLLSRNDFFAVTQEVWAIGFPRGIRVNGFPVWKRATIASEPGFSFAETPHKILLDTATREGMSGSPVFFVSRATSRTLFDGIRQEMDVPLTKLLLGIYSGRILGEDELAAQLGIAWGAECIEEILSAQHRYAE